MNIDYVKNKVRGDLEKWIDIYNDDPRTDGNATVKEYSKGRIDAYCEINLFLERINHESK